MNTIEEILKKKNENIYDTYKKIFCNECSNKNNNKDLCKITVTIEGKAKCFNYERCMKTKCKSCRNEKECFKENG